GKRGKASGITLGIPELDGKILALDEPSLAQPLDQGFSERRGTRVDRGEDTELDRLRRGLGFGGVRRGEEAPSQGTEKRAAVHARSAWPRVLPTSRERRRRGSAVARRGER